MNTISEITSVIRQVLSEPCGGIVELTDRALDACLKHDLQLDWQPSLCRVRSRDGDWEDVDDLPIRKSAFRAILARVAVKCNEHAVDSVSPYGGEGILSFGENPVRSFLVRFANTSSQQRLELTLMASPTGGC